MTTVNSEVEAQGVMDPELTALTELGVRAQAELDQLDAERDGLERQIRTLDEKRRTYRRVLNALAPPVPHVTKSKPKPVRKGIPTEKTLRAIQKGIQALVNEGVTEFSVRQVWEAQGGKKGHSPWHEAFAQLREVGYLGKAGVAQPGTVIGKLPQLWTVLDAAVMERLING